MVSGLWPGSPPSSFEAPPWNPSGLLFYPFFFFYCGVNRPEGGKVTGAGQSVQTQELDSFLSFYLKETRVTSSPLCELLVTISDHWPDGEQKLCLS